MLILTRKPGESITLDGQITTPIKITLMSVTGHQIRLGIDATASVRIHRTEVIEQIRADRAAAESKVPQ